MKRVYLIIVFLSVFFCGYTQPYITTSTSPSLNSLIDTLVASCSGSGSGVSNATSPSCAHYGYFNYNGSGFPFEAGIILTTGNVAAAVGPNTSSSTSGTACLGSDPDLAAIANGYSVMDVSKIEFDFIPQLNTVSFRYIFASEEFPEFANSSFNDVFGFFLSGPGLSGPFSNGAVNIAVLPNGQPATINNIYNNAAYYVGNPGPNPYGNSTEFDGCSIVLTATSNVVPGQIYHIKIAVGDCGDSSFDSAVFLEKGSLIIVENGGLASITNEVSTNESGGVSSGSYTTTLTCNNPSIQIQAHGGDIYQWSGGIPNSDGTVLTVIQPGTYTVTITQTLCNSTETHSITITQNVTPPNISITNNTGTTILNCHTSYIDVTAVGGVSYVWSGGITPNSATNTFYMPGSYTVTATAANGCTSSSTITITFQVDMYIVDTSYSNVLCYGANDGNIIVQFQGGFPPFQYQWSDGATTLNRNNIGSGIYTLTITDFYGCTLSETFTISEPPQLLISDTSYNHLSCFESNDGNISVSITGGTLPYTVIWNDNTSSLYRNNLSSGIYAVTIIDAHNCFVMEQFIITQPEAMSIVTGNNQIICEGSSVILQAQVQGGTMPYTYYWSETPTPNDYTTGNYARQVTPATTTTYRVYVTDAKGCQTTVDSTKIIVSPYIVIDSLKIKDNSCYHSCDGEATVYYHGGTIPINLSWASPNNTLHDLCVGQYSLTMTDQYGCSTSTSFFIDEPYELVSSTYSVPTRCYGSSDGIAEVYLQGGTQPYTYLWYDGTTTSRITVSAGYYEVTIYDANHCRLTSGFNITEPTALISAPLHSQTICYGQNISLQTNSSGGTPPYDYHWTDNQGNEHFGNIWNVTPIDTTIYTVTVSDANNCSLTLNPATININGKLEILSLVADQPIICPGYDCEIRADVRGGNGGPYMMRLQDGRIVGSPFIVSPTETTTYYITVDDMCGTIPVIDSITIEVRPNPTINFIPSVYAGCPPLEMEFTYQSDYDFESYFWLFGNNSYSAEKNSHHTYIESGIYDVTLEVTDALGCVHKKTLKDLITVYPLPQASFSFTPEIATTVSPEVTFVNHSNGAIAYYWNLGDGDSSRNEHPIHNYMPSVNSYEVCLIAETNHLCRDTACREVKVEDLTALYFPNSFTPDGDGINDCFKPCGNFISQKDFHLTVIDRFGEVVFESDKYDDTEKATDCSECSEHAWNGKMKNTGNVLQNGIYIWQCIYKDGYGIRYEKTGHVLLVR